MEKKISKSKAVIITFVAVGVVVIFLSFFAVDNIISTENIYWNNVSLFDTLLNAIATGPETLYMVDASNYQSVFQMQDPFEAYFQKGFQYISITDERILFCKTSNWGSTSGVAYVLDDSSLNLPKYAFEHLEGK